MYLIAVPAALQGQAIVRNITQRSDLDGTIRADMLRLEYQSRETFRIIDWSRRMYADRYRLADAARKLGAESNSPIIAVSQTILACATTMF